MAKKLDKEARLAMIKNRHKRLQMIKTLINEDDDIEDSDLSELGDFEFDEDEDDGDDFSIDSFIRRG